MKYRLIGLLGSVALASSTMASADDTQERHKVVFENITVGRVNPLGLVNVLNVGYHMKLYHHDSPLLAQNRFELVGRTLLSPAYVRVGAEAALMPLSILRVSAMAERIQYFGTFGHLQAFDDPGADYSDATLEALADDDAHEATGGTQFSINGLLQLKAGPIAVRSNFRLARVDYDFDEVAFYDPILDLMSPTEGWFYTNDADLLYVSDAGLIAGIRYNISKAYHGADGDPNGSIHRVGPIVIWAFRERDQGMVQSVSALAVVNWYAAHRYRAGAETSRWVPMVALGAIVRGDLL